MKRFTVLSLLLLALTACQKPLLPQEVADLYWAAVQNKDSTKIKQYSTAFWDADTEALDSLPAIDSFEFGQIVINDTNAEIDTRLVLTGDEPNTIQLKTYLLQTENIWKVDFNKTMQGVQPMDFNDMLEELAELSEMLKDEFNQSLDEIDKAIPKIEEGISEFGDKLEEGIPELQNKIDELVKKLQELLDSPKETEQSGAGTTEI